MHVCMYACVHVCMYACMHVCMYAFVGPMLLVSREWTREGRVCCGSNKVYRGSAACTDCSINYDVRGHVNTYSKERKCAQMCEQTM